MKQAYGRTGSSRWIFVYYEYEIMYLKFIFVACVDSYRTQSVRERELNFGSSLFMKVKVLCAYLTGCVSISLEATNHSQDSRYIHMNRRSQAAWMDGVGVTLYGYGSVRSAPELVDSPRSVQFFFF